MHLISTPEQYDRMINQGSTLIDERLFSPEMAELHRQYAQAGRDTTEGHLERANATYEKILERWPTFVAARYNLAGSLLRLGHVDQARRQITLCDAYGDPDPDVFTLAGIICEAAGDLGAELMYYQRAYATNKRHFKSVHFLVISYRQQGWWPVARGWLEVLDAQIQAKLDLDPRSVTREEALALEWNWGLVHEHFGNLQKAIEHFETADEVSPGNKEILTKLREARQRARQT